MITNVFGTSIWELRFFDLSFAPMDKPYIILRIDAIREETQDTKSFILSNVSNHPIHYKQGQFLTLVFPKKINEERRSYSISSNPLFNEPLTITVKRIDNGEFSRFLFDTCKPGDEIYTIGPSGFFTLPDNLKSFDTVFFFAAGSGITPMLPMIETILHTERSLKVYLIYSSRSAYTTIFLSRLRALQEQFRDTFVLELLFSSSQNLLKARLSKALTAEYLRKWAPAKEKSLFYMCGPHDYMQMLSITLLAEGVNPVHIRKEIFDHIKPVVKQRPPDEDVHEVTVSYEGNQYRFPVQYPTTILQAAKKRGIILPYSCEAGKCGTCSATCTSGKVWMSYNEVLLDKELEQGRVLTCMGYPIEGDVALEFPDLT